MNAERPVSHRPRKRFGQNFLHDPAVIAKLIEFIRPQVDDTIVEIGPGQGALTGPLLERCRHLHAVEIDRDLAPRLVEHFGEAITVHAVDALRVDLASLAPQQPLRVVGNLPYNISTPLLFHVLAHTACIRDMHFMLQREVVDRICAQPGNKTYGRLTVCIHARADVRRLLRIGPGAFRPAPKVESAFVRLTPRTPDYAIPDLSVFDHIVTTAFGKRRKTLTNALSGTLSADQIQAAGIDPRVRAEMLAPSDFASLARIAAHRSGITPDPPLDLP